MKLKTHALSLVLLTIISSCSNNDEPNIPVFMQPASITANDADGGNQTFEYYDNGKIVAWSLKYSDNESIIARYSYPDDNTINIESEEVSYDTRTYRTETIQLLNGRASTSEGKFTRMQDNDIQIQKTYRLEFDYTADNHLGAVKHSELLGATANDWDKSWTWENYLVWENGNLKEYQDFSGNTAFYQTTKYQYSAYAVAYPVIIPKVINSLHHNPLMMQGIFGLNSNNLLQTSTIFDKSGNSILTRSFTYEFNNAALIDQYTETTTYTTYKVNWTTK